MGLTHYPDLGKWHGECRLILDGTRLSLVRYNGCHLVIDGKQQIIPQAGASLAPTGLTASTSYYIYAAIVSGQLVLEASTTGHAPDARNGVESKSGDPSRTLVGLARTIAGPAWVCTASQLFVISYHNRLARHVQNVFSSDKTTASLSPVEISPSERAEFICWGDEPVTARQTVIASISAITGIVCGTTIDSTGFIDGLYGIVIVPAINYTVNLSCGQSIQLTDGYHFATLTGYVGGGTGKYYGGPTPGGRCVINVRIQG